MDFFLCKQKTAYEFWLGLGSDGCSADLERFELEFALLEPSGLHSALLGPSELDSALLERSELDSGLLGLS